MEIRDSEQRPHYRLDVWQDAMQLVEKIYEFSSTFPGEERFGLAAQIRRAAISVPSNIAEGAARRSRADYLRFLSFARGSLSELDTQILLAVRLGYGNPTRDVAHLLDRLFARLNALIKSIDAPEPS